MTTLTRRFLTENEIKDMSEAAINNFEFSCSWHKSCVAAQEHAVDEFGVKPSKSAVLLAVKLARVKWEAISMSTNNHINKTE